VTWLLGGVWLLAAELLRRSAIQVLTFIATAGIVMWVIWPGRSSDAAVPINRIVVPGFLVLLALLVRRLYGPIRPGRLPRADGRLPRRARDGRRPLSPAARRTEARRLLRPRGRPHTHLRPGRLLRAHARGLCRRDPDPHLTTRSTDPFGPADRARDRDAHRPGNVRTFQRSSVERGEGNVGGEPGIGMVVVRRAWATPAHGLHGCTTRRAG
jgi:hypothetical protein